MTDFNVNDALVEMFLFETTQLLEQLEQVVLSSEANGHYTEEDINEIFRILHTIKGSSAMMKYNEMFVLAHALEDLFSYLRKEKPEQTFYSSLSDLILECVDFFKIELEYIRNGEVESGSAADLVHRVKDFLSGLKQGASGLTNKPADDENLKIYRAVIYFQEGCEMENIRAFAVIHNLKNIATEIVYYPRNIEESDDTIEIIRHHGFWIYFKTDRPQDQVYDHFMKTIFLKDLELAEIDEETFAKGFTDEMFVDEASADSACDTPQQAEADSSGQWKETENSQEKDSSADKGSGEEKKQHNADGHVLPTQSIISVSVAKLDKLMDLVGEMVIAEAMVIQNPDLKGLELNNFHKAATQLNKITSEIQDIVMSIRMVPLSATFQRMNRIVRDMCRKLNKEVYLKIIGEETEVDKNIIEHITDPLMHLVRNAVDHGIESAEERMAIGKPSYGTITLEANNVGSDVHIIIRDDGRGLDREKILKKAVENNLLTIDEMNEGNISDDEIYKLILLPGFSTKDSVTEFSGRGVGMDVVAKNIESIGGSISINSEKDKGTQITLKIPLTLAIIDGMNLQVGKSIFTIPTISIRESFRPTKDQIIVDPEGNEIIMVRGECYPILRLHEFYKLKTNVTDFTEGIIIMVSHEGKTICIFADRLLGQQQVVLKSLPDYIKRFRKIRGISGCTMLGDGSISLILDIANLIHAK